MSNRKSDWGAVAFWIFTGTTPALFQCAACGKKLFLPNMTTHVIKSFIEKKGCQ